MASSPSDLDFACGFQASLSGGILSSTRRVAGISSRNSFRMDSTMGTILCLLLGRWCVPCTLDGHEWLRSLRSEPSNRSAEGEEYKGMANRESRIQLTHGLKSFGRWRLPVTETCSRQQRHVLSVTLGCDLHT